MENYGILWIDPGILWIDYRFRKFRLLTPRGPYVLPMIGSQVRRPKQPKFREFKI